MRTIRQSWFGAAAAALLALATLAGPATAPLSGGVPAVGPSVDRGAPAVPFAAALSGLPTDLSTEPDGHGPRLEPGSPKRAGWPGAVVPGTAMRAAPPVSGFAALLRRGFLAGPRAPPVPSP